MNLSSGVSLGQLILALAVMLTTGGVAWGSLMQRVKTLESQMSAMAGFGSTLATIDERTKNTAADVREMKSSFLFQDPPPYGAVHRPRSEP